MKKTFDELTLAEMVKENEKTINTLRYGIIGMVFVIFLSITLVASLFINF